MTLRKARVWRLYDRGFSARARIDLLKACARVDKGCSYAVLKREFYDWCVDAATSEYPVFVSENDRVGDYDTDDDEYTDDDAYLPAYEQFDNGDGCQAWFKRFCTDLQDIFGKGVLSDVVLDGYAGSHDCKQTVLHVARPDDIFEEKRGRRDCCYSKIAMQRLMPDELAISEKEYNTLKIYELILGIDDQRGTLGLENDDQSGYSVDDTPPAIHGPRWIHTEFAHYK